MSEEQRATNNKVTLPKQTKTAIMLMIVFEIVGVIVICLQGLITNMECGSNCMRDTYVALGLCVLYILPTMFICIKNRIGWILAILMLSGIVIAALIEMFLKNFSFPFFIPLLLFTIASLVFIIRDRNNYFEMLRQRELEKK